MASANADERVGNHDEAERIIPARFARRGLAMRPDERWQPNRARSEQGGSHLPPGKPGEVIVRNKQPHKASEATGLQVANHLTMISRPIEGGISSNAKSPARHDEGPRVSF